MHFSKTEIDEIIRLISSRGIKDIDFSEVTTVSGEDYVAIVQNGTNKKIKIRNLIKGTESGSSSGGQSQYIFVAYSNDNGATLTANDGTVEGKYLGFCISATNSRPLTASYYTWIKLGGEEGIGNEFIYKTTTSSFAPDVPESGNNDEYIPEGWTNDPQDVSDDSPYVWMCSRKKVGGVWGTFRGSAVNSGKAALFGKLGRDGLNGQDGVSPNTSFKSIVFKRSNDKVTLPVGGSYESPVPIGWSDGVPTGNEQLWMSTRIFSSDGNSPQQESWSSPEIVSDNEYLDYEFSSAESPGVPSKASPSAPEANSNWSNAASEDTIWMAMRKVSNGAYEANSTWMIVKIKGEKGEDGTSVDIKGTKDSEAELPSTGNATGDSYLIDGSLYVWSGQAWVNAGKIQGPAGPAGPAGADGYNGNSAYLHIKYANLVDGKYEFTSNNGETPGDYIGMYWDFYSSDSSDMADYKWHYWRGADGFGYEYIFKLTADNTAPSVPSDISQDDDYIPEGWTDNAGDVSDEYPYCWVCYRKKIEGLWGKFIGSSSNNGKAALFAHYGKDGQIGIGITKVHEWYAVSSNSTTPPEKGTDRWTTSVPTLDATNKYLWNYEEIIYSNGDTTQTEPCVIGVFGKDGVGIANIEEYYCISEYSTGVTMDNVTWTSTSLIMTSDYPYLWNYEKIVYTDGSYHNTNPVVIGIYGVRTDDDLDYLNAVFGEDNVSGENGALVRNLLGVTSVDDSSRIVAMVNGSDIGKDAKHGKLVFAAGMKGIAQPTDIAKAKFKVYEDGSVELIDVTGVNVNLSGTITAIGGTIGPFRIDEYSSLTAELKDSENEHFSTLKLSAGAMVYEAKGNGWGGQAIIGYRSENDHAMVTLTSTSEDPALCVSGSGDSYAMLVQSGALTLVNGGYLQLNTANSNIYGIRGHYEGFRTPIEVIDGSSSDDFYLKSSDYDLKHHTVILINDKRKLVLPSTPVEGDEFDVIAIDDLNTNPFTVSLNLNGNIAYEVKDGKAEKYSYTFTVRSNYHYKIWWTGDFWMIARA